MAVITLTKAVALIKSHGHRAEINAEGIKATCEAVQNGVVFDAEQQFFALPSAYYQEIRRVSKEAIMDWLGY